MKRGIEALEKTVFHIMLALFLFVVLFLFVSKAGMEKPEIIAKQIALFINIAKPGTEITIFKKENYSVEIDQHKIKILMPAKTYEYDFFSMHKIEIENAKDYTKIIVK